MANNTTLNPGSGGDTIATDDIAGVKYQRVKLVDGTEDSAAGIPGDATNGLFVNVKALPALVAGSAVIGKVDVNTDPAQAVDGGSLPAVVQVVGGFDGVNVQAVKTDSAGVLQTQEVNVSAGDVAGTLTNGRKTVTTPGTAVALSASAACAWVSVTALPSNGDVVAVGGSGVLATVGSETGLLLGPGASVTVPTNNVSKVFVDAVVAGNGVSFLAGAL